MGNGHDGLSSDGFQNPQSEFQPVKCEWAAQEWDTSGFINPCPATNKLCPGPGENYLLSEPQFPPLESGHKGLSPCLFGVGSLGMSDLALEMENEQLSSSLVWIVIGIVASVLVPGIVSFPAVNRAACEQVPESVFLRAGSLPLLSSSPSILAQDLVPAAELLGLSPTSLMWV